MTFNSQHWQPSIRMRSAVHGQAGFTLVELMIAMLLGLLIIGGVIAVFLSNKQTYSTHNALSQVQDGSRTTFELLSRDIRETGLTGCGNAGRIANVLNNGPNGPGTRRWYADIANAIRGFDGDTADTATTFSTATTAPTVADIGLRVRDTSSIQVVGGDGLGMTVASHDTTNARITINETTNLLSAGDMIVICDPDHAAITQVTSLAGSPAVLTLATGTSGPGNCSTGLGFPTQCTSTGSVYSYIANSQVSKLYAAHWYIGFNPVGGRSLYRIGIPLVGGVPTETPQEMVRNVSNMTIEYHVQGGTNFDTAASVTDWSTVDAVMINLRLESASKFAGTTSKTAIFRNMPLTVTLRNRVQ